MEKKYITDNPILISEWNYEKNIDLDPSKLTLGSNKKVWWICSKGHEWQAMINNRSKGNGCPYCSNKKILTGYNDLQTLNPILANEWNFEKNGTLLPTDVTIFSNKKVWWKCDKGHEWQSTVSHRSDGTKCPFCHLEHNTSLPEYAIEYYLKKCNIDVVHSYKEKGYELDIYIPSMKIAIEYDGSFWHKNKSDLDLEKNAKCKKDDIKLYRIREGLPSLNDSSIDYIIQDNQTDLQKVLSKILSEISGIDVDVNLKRDNIEIENLREHSEKESSLLFSNPALAREWNYEKNGMLKPEYFLSNSNKKVWWKCNKKHEWQASIINRNKGNGCPYCAGRRVVKGLNDLQTINSDLAKEWNYEKNGDLKPEHMSSNSNKKVWWKCGKGHEWLATIAHRNNGRGCPYCSGRKILKGYNDLNTVNPVLASKWNYEKNSELTPESFTANSGKKVWWKCEKGHEWLATIDSQNKGHGCPYCAGQKVLAGYNDLQTTNPILAKEWNYKRNILTPTEVSSNSHKKVWWKCENGHEWQATIYNRNNGRGCPYCSGRKKPDSD